MDLISVPLAVTLMVVGAGAIAAATRVARRQPSGVRRGAGERGPLTLLVPWAGSVLVLVLLVRGALPAAGFVAVATLVHAVVARARASGPG